MRATPERQPADFADILCGAELPLIVGGQAVNLWAEVYGHALPAMESFEPFVSKDADIYGNYLADVVTAGFAGNAARAHGLDLARVFPPSLWLSGAPALQPVVARLKAHGLGPPADSSSPEFSPD